MESETHCWVCPTCGPVDAVDVRGVLHVEWHNKDGNVPLEDFKEDEAGEALGTPDEYTSHDIQEVTCHNCFDLCDWQERKRAEKEMADERNENQKT